MRIADWSDNPSEFDRKHMHTLVLLTKSAFVLIVTCSEAVQMILLPHVGLMAKAMRPDLSNRVMFL